MAFAFVGAADLGNNGGTTTSLSVSYTVGSGSNRLLVVDLEGDVSIATGGHDDITSVTYNGVALTLAATIAGTATNRFTYKYFLINPASGANNVAITCTNAHYLLAVALDYTGARQSAQPDATITNAANSVTTLTTSLTTVADNCWVSLLGTGGSLPAAGAGVTRRAIETQFSTFGAFDSNGPVTPPGAYSMTTTATTSGTIDHLAASFAPALVGVFSDTAAGCDLSLIARSDRAASCEPSLAARSGNERRLTVWGP